MVLNFKVAAGLIFAGMLAVKPVIAQECSDTGQGISEDRFTYNASVATDSSTNLMWSRCPVGQEVSDSQCVDQSAGPSGYEVWQVHLVAINNITYGGYSDWRMPSIVEMRSIMDYTCVAPVIDPTVFPLTAFYNPFWTSTSALLLDRNEGQTTVGYAWTASLLTGEFSAGSTTLKNLYYQSMMVRDVTTTTE